MICDEANGVIKERFDSLKDIYQNNLESTKGSEFVLDYDHLMYCKCQKKNLNHIQSYVDSTEWTENKKTTINSINKNKCQEKMFVRNLRKIM